MVTHVIIELRGKRVRVMVYRDGDDLQFELTPIWDPTYEHPVILIVDKSRAREEVEALINEITQLLRKALLEATKSEVQ